LIEDLGPWPGPESDFHKLLSTFTAVHRFGPCANPRPHLSVTSTDF
jgi:hypothetical protein